MVDQVRNLFNGDCLKRSEKLNIEKVTYYGYVFFKELFRVNFQSRANFYVHMWFGI